MKNKKKHTLPEEVRQFFAEQGHIGGKMGAKARLKKVPAERRKEIATKAAKARWKKEQGHERGHDS
jgi:hypothetical protein